jgi:hypothetical protein
MEVCDMRVSARGLLLVLALSLAAGCHKATPVEPTDPLGGVWSGAIVDSEAGPGTIQWTMVQNGPGLSGQWSASYSNASSNQSGAFTGTLIGPAVTLFLAPSTPIACGAGLTLSGTLSVNGSVMNGHLSGSYVVLTCASAKTGTIDLVKQ